MKQRLRASVAMTMVVLMTVFAVFMSPLSTYASTVDVGAKSAILVDADTGKILYEKEADLTLPPASMTKMMTEYLVLEAIDEGRISWDTTTQISPYAYEISANPEYSGVGLKMNKDYTVRELYEAMAINSDNATTITLAELVGGSEGEFVKMMNEKAKELGLPDYEFVNASGLDNAHLGDNHPEGTAADGVNMLSAKSAATLAYHLINNYPQALEISSQPTLEFEGKTVTNWNWMLPGMPGENLKQFEYEGMDGLKTGYTELAGNTFTGTAERDGVRLISVVMKSETRESRFQQTAELLDYGFQQFSRQELFPAGYAKEEESTVSVAKGKEDSVAIETSEALSTMVKNAEEDQYTLEYKLDKDKLNEDGELVAPVKKGDKVGTAVLVYNGEDNYSNLVSDEGETVELVAAEDVDKSNWFMLMLGAIGQFFADIFTGAVDMVKGWF
ncbi:serine hydrolase [Halobacillus sp. ACCC02827]|uniref:serine hydrolase n=1 Tax=unclassified Halobacillus TaxID=2636472 RepID=UPI0002A51653|nr:MULTISPECIES: serine hydrolase [unclassified Halobacillus]ELK46771.1 serine-type D-Ala-D-Ala carboxypeptidase [Halobacillus sp. BAB-2008]WJE15833.1 serine hydrolase [Halobacillus sp. ACCC02827]